MSPALDIRLVASLGGHGHTRYLGVLLDRVRLSLAGPNLFELSEDDPAVNRSTLLRSSYLALLYKFPDSAEPSAAYCHTVYVGNGACIRAAEIGSDWF
jgi:hypothetical protein